MICETPSHKEQVEDVVVRMRVEKELPHTWQNVKKTECIRGNGLLQEQQADFLVFWESQAQT